MEPQFISTLAYSIIAGAATLGGVYLIFFNEAWTRRNSIFFLSFSGGVVLTAAFTHLLPEAYEITRYSFGVVLATIIAYYIVEHTIAIHTCKEDECEVHPMGIPAFIGITTHSLIDGIVIGVSFEADFTMGFITAVAVILHKFPVGITITSILVHSGFKRVRILALGWVVALATVVGAVGAYMFVRTVEQDILGIMLAFSAGSFIYIGASDLLPETHKKMSKANIMLVLAGVVLVYLIAHLTGGH